jgi:hypothetical protein
MLAPLTNLLVVAVTDAQNQVVVGDQGVGFGALHDQDAPSTHPSSTMPAPSLVSVLVALLQYHLQSIMTATPCQLMRLCSIQSLIECPPALHKLEECAFPSYTSATSATKVLVYHFGGYKMSL